MTSAHTRRDVDDWEPRIIEVIGRFTAASNARLLATTDLDETVIYKPVAGERPLYDFAPGTLAIREVMTYLVDHALGFGLVPEVAQGEPRTADLRRQALFEPGPSLGCPHSWGTLETSHRCT